MKLHFILFLSLLVLFSCQSKIVEKKPIIAPQPAWILQPPTDTATYIYGVGEGGNRKQAIQSGLADLAAKISVTVSAEFSRVTTVRKREIELVSQDANKNVKTKVTNIKISHYSVDKVYSPIPTKVFVLVKANRKQIFNSYKQELDNHISNFNSNKENAKNLGNFAYYQFLKNEQLELANFNNNRLIASSLNSNFNNKKYLRHEQNVNNDINKLTAKFNFQVVATNATSKPFANALKSRLAQLKLLGNNSSKLKIEANTSRSLSKSHGFTVQQFQISLTLKENNRPVNSKIISIKHVGLETGETVPNKAVEKFLKKLPPIVDW